jgi:hypothetical protein
MKKLILVWGNILISAAFGASVWNTIPDLIAILPAMAGLISGYSAYVIYREL